MNVSGDSQPLPVRAVETERSPWSSGSGAERMASSRSSLELSARGAELQDVSRAALEAPAFRADRVAALREQIQTGAYVVDTARLADHLARLL